MFTTSYRTNCMTVQYEGHCVSKLSLFSADTTPPTGFAVTGPPRRTNKPRATFKWQTSEDANYDCFLDDQADPVKCGAGTNGVFTTEPLPDGEHDFSVVATDNLGNKAPIFNSKWTVGMQLISYISFIYS